MKVEVETSQEIADGTTTNDNEDVPEVAAEVPNVDDMDDDVIVNSGEDEGIIEGECEDGCDKEM